MARLILEDGRIFQGQALGSSRNCFAEIVFNTGMTGYQETISDPSYAGQIITFTYPEIGNYGVNDEDMESRIPYAKGIVIKNYSPIVSNFRAKASLEEALRRYDIPAIVGVDTRALTRHLRDRGAMRAAIVVDDSIDDKQALSELLQTPSMTGLDLASIVSTKSIYHSNITNPKLKIIAYDFGIKQNIINKLNQYGCSVTVVPADTPASFVLEANPDGVFLSNGPGDPAAVTYAIETVRDLIQNYKKPIFGICLGHQILALAAGAKTFKLKFGHRGSNQPIKNLSTQRIEIASHNHGFAVEKETLPENVEITHLNINDNTIAGIKLKTRQDVFSVQYHPEASPGPHDSDYLFQDFTSLCLKC